MSLGAGAYRLGPDNGALILHTGREGSAARVGHDLTLTFTAWSGQVVVGGGSPVDVRVEATVDVSSLEILAGTGGVVPLTGIDRRHIRSTALRILDVDRHPEATFVSTLVDVAGDQATLSGTLTIRGSAVPASFTVAGVESWRAATVIKQSDFGIKPYRAFLGALRLADDVGIEVEAEVTPSGGDGPLRPGSQRRPRTR